MVGLLQKIAAAETAATGDAVHGQAAALRQLWALAWREAQTATFADAFRIIAAGFLIATLMVPLMRKTAPRRAAPPADAH
jgi:DHA2 family multidrug resistance protein